METFLTLITSIIIVIVLYIIGRLSTGWHYDMSIFKCIIFGILGVALFIFFGSLIIGASCAIVQVLI